MTVDLRTTPPPQLSKPQGYWDDPRRQTDGFDSPNDLNRNPVSAATSSEQTQIRTLRSPQAAAISVNGDNTNPSERSAGSTSDGKPIQIDPLHQGARAKITRERTLANGGQNYITNDQLVFTTTGDGNEQNDQVRVSQRDDGTVEVNVNGEAYDVNLAERQELTLRVGAGDDLVEIAPNVRVNIVIDGGDGDDAAMVQGSGDTRIDAGAGNDNVDLSASSGRNDVFGNAGNDEIIGGTGANILYGGDGEDILTSAAGSNFLEGGAGNDQLVATVGKTVVSAGLGDDRVTSGGDNAIYLGAGQDSVEGATAADTVYAESIDAVRFAAGQGDTSQVVVNVEIDPSLGVDSITVQGSPAFRQRVEAEIEMLRSSPTGREMLVELDAAAARGNTVEIRELQNEQNGYARTLDRANSDIRAGRAGSGSDVQVSYNPSFHMEEFPAPSVVMYHELSHAYNGVTGSFQPGTYQGDGPDSGRVPNAERQAVGLATSAESFDFDNDPSTPPTTHNPIELTENGIRREIGLPDRPNYTL